MFTRQPCGVVQKVVDKAEAVRGNIAQAPGWRLHAASQLRSTPAYERDTDHLPVALPGGLLDSKNSSRRVSASSRRPFLSSKMRVSPVLEPIEANAWMRWSRRPTSRSRDRQSSNDAGELPSLPRLRMFGIQFMRSVCPDMPSRSIPNKLQKDLEVHKGQRG